MKKRDFILIAILLAAACLGLGIQKLTEKTGASLQIMMDGEIFGIYSLNEDQTINIGDSNRCEILDGKVFMTWADCPDQICVKHKEIASGKESIVCLPNRVILTILEEQDGRQDDSQADTIAS